MVCQEEAGISSHTAADHNKTWVKPWNMMVSFILPYHTALSVSVCLSVCVLYTRTNTHTDFPSHWLHVSPVSDCVSLPSHPASDQLFRCLSVVVSL